MGGEVWSGGLEGLGWGGSLTTRGYSASRKRTIDVTDLIVPQASIRSLNMFPQRRATVTDAWKAIFSLLQSPSIKPIQAKTIPLVEAADARLYTLEYAPSGEASS